MVAAAVVVVVVGRVVLLFFGAFENGDFSSSMGISALASFKSLSSSPKIFLSSLLMNEMAQPGTPIRPARPI